MPPQESEEKHLPKGDQPHLRFEITSDDGFSVEADSIEGEIQPSVPFNANLSFLHEFIICTNSDYMKSLPRVFGFVIKFG